MARSAQALAALLAVAGAVALVVSASGFAQHRAATRALRAVAANATRVDRSRRGLGQGDNSICLCIFGLDRVLTGQQGDTCGGVNKVIDGVRDPSHGGGNLTLSALGQAGVNRTFCSSCALGLVTSGDGGGADMRERIAGEALGGRAGFNWSDASVRWPLVTGCPDFRKARCAEGIVDWYRERGTAISYQDVHFFDDSAISIGSFRFTTMNAVQVSCWSRSGDDGLCGATPEEVAVQMGLRFCI